MLNYIKYKFLITYVIDSHFVMVRKMIGSHSIGTAGTTGSEYLRSTLR